MKKEVINKSTKLPTQTIDHFYAKQGGYPCILHKNCVRFTYKHSLFGTLFDHHYKPPKTYKKSKPL